MKTKYYNEKRAVQAAARFAKLAGGTIDKYKLCKIMYYLERQTIVETGQPLINDKLYSAPLGPIASEVNHGIDAVVPPRNRSPFYQVQPHHNWEDHFILSGESNLQLTEKPGDGELSIADINRINEIHVKFKNFTYNELEEFFHNLPEFEETNHNIPIPFTEILRVEGVSEEEIGELQEEYDYFLKTVAV